MAPTVIKTVERIIVPTKTIYSLARLSGSLRIFSIGSMLKIKPLYNFKGYLTKNMYWVAVGNTFLSSFTSAL